MFILKECGLTWVGTKKGPLKRAGTTLFSQSFRTDEWLLPSQGGVELILMGRVWVKAVWLLNLQKFVKRVTKGQRNDVLCKHLFKELSVLPLPVYVHT